MWPRLERIGYYSRPSTQALWERGEEAIAAVDGLEIGRLGYGRVIWEDAVDVRGVDLDRSVEIGTGYVSVAARAGSEHDIKFGGETVLSKRAVVVLESLSSCGVAHEPEDGDSCKSCDMYAEKLRSRCASQGASFLFFDRRRRELGFRVEHFSRYGFMDDDSDEDGGQTSMRTTTETRASAEEKQDVKMTTKKDFGENEAGKASTSSRILSVPEDWSDAGDENEPDPYADVPMMDKEDLDTSRSTVFNNVEIPKLNRMHRLLFAGATDRETSASSLVQESMVEESFVSADIDDDMTRRVKARQGFAAGGSPGPTKAFSVTKLKTAIQQTEPNTPLLSSLHLFKRMEDSVSYEREGTVSDPMLAFGRSFRIGFSPDGRLSRLILPEHAGESFGVAISRPQDRNLLKREFIDKSMMIHMAGWRKEEALEHASDSTLQPSFDGMFGSTFSARNSCLEGLIEHFGSSNYGHLSIVFGLLLAIYGDYDNQREHVLRNRLSKWLSEQACPWSQHSPPVASYLQKVLSLISCGMVDDAADLLLANGDYRLALLLARASEFPGKSLQKDVLVFASRFAEGQTDDSLRKDMNDLLSVLSGEVQFAKILKSLSWYRAFALFLWYSRQGREKMSIRPSLESFMQAWSELRVTAAPVPPHATELDLTERLDLANSPETDAAYGILCLFSNIDTKSGLEGVYSTNSVGSRKHPLDFYGSWFIFQWLKGIVGPSATIRREIRIHSAFSQQLEASDAPLWAFHVLASAPQSVERDSALRSLLWRNWPKMMNDKVHREDGSEITGEEYLLNCLGVPLDWILEARSLWARYNMDHAREVEILCQLAKTDEADLAMEQAHVIICDVLVPRFVSLAVQRCRGWDSIGSRLMNLLSELSGSSLPGWDVKGGIVWRFLTLLCEQEDIRSELWNDTTALHSFVSGVAKYEAEDTEEGKFLKLVMGNVGASLERRLYLKMVAEGGEDIAASWGEVVRSDLIQVCLSSSHGLQLAGQYSGDDKLGAYANLLWSIPLGHNFGLPIGL